MGDVIGFRATPEDRRIIDRTKARLGLKSDAAALRHLVRAGDVRTSLADASVFRFRVPSEFRLSKGRTLTSKDVDDLVYGGS